MKIEISLGSARMKADGFEIVKGEERTHRVPVQNLEPWPARDIEIELRAVRRTDGGTKEVGGVFDVVSYPRELMPKETGELVFKARIPDHADFPMKMVSSVKAVHDQVWRF